MNLPAAYFISMTKSECDQVLENNKNFLSILSNHQILGSYRRGESEVNDLDILFDKDLFDLNKYRGLKPFLKSNKIFLEINDSHMIIKGHLDGMKFEAYGIESKFFPSWSCLMIGPQSRYEFLLEEAKRRGFYMTHFGLLKSNELMDQDLAEKICFASDEKILFDAADEYERFIYSQPVSNEKKVFNIIKKHWKNEYFFSTEKSFYIEPTTRCNCNCIMCTRRVKEPDLTFDPFKTILDKLNPLHVKFWGRGESLINRDCWKMIDEMKRRDIIIYLTTNFNLDIDWKTISKVDVLYISLHTFNETNYLKIIGKPIDKVLENLLHAIDLKLNVVIKSVVMQDNGDDIKQFIETAEKYGIKYVTTNVRSPNNETPSPYWTCRQPNYPFISAAGIIYPCCMTPFSANMGSIYKDNLDPKVITLAKARCLNECRFCELR
jgi:MoaA/NifB/PqqE/SkfB family radical SAM enzyme